MAPCFEYFFYDVVLVRRSDGGNDFHLLAAGRAQGGIFKVNLGYETGPGFLFEAHELALVFLGDHDFFGALRAVLSGWVARVIVSNPAQCFTNRGGQGPKRMDAALESKGHMGNEHRQELKARDQLVVPAQGRVVVAFVKNAAIVEVFQSAEGNGWSLHVLEDRFKLLALALRMSPRTKKLDSLGRDLFFSSWA